MRFSLLGTNCSVRYHIRRNAPMYRYSILCPVCCSEWGSSNSISINRFNSVAFDLFFVPEWVCVVIKSGFKDCFTASHIIHDFALVSFLFPRSSGVGSISCSLWELLWCYIACRLFHGNVSSSWWGWGFLRRHCCCLYDWLYVTSPIHRTVGRVAAIAWFFLGRNAFFQDPLVVIRYYAFHVWHAAIAYFESLSVANFIFRA